MLALRPVAPWALAAKRIRADGTVEPYRLGREFVGAECGWRSAREAFDGLEILRGRPDLCLVRGTLLHSAPRPFPRRYRGEDRAIAPCARNLLGVDFDDVGPAATVREAADRAIARLPQPLRAGPVRAQLTASATPANARVRLWLWLAAPAGDRACRDALRGVADCALYSPVQPHYTADAVREIADPFPERVCEIELPGEATLGGTDDLAAQAAELLTIHTKRITRAREGARHKAVNAGAYELGRYVGAGLVPRDVVRDALVIAAMQAKLTAERAADEIDRAIADGERRPIVEDAWRARLARGPDGAVRTSETNALAVLLNDPAWADRIARDVCSRVSVWVDPPPWAQPGPIADAEHLLIAQEIERQHRLTFSASAIGAAVATAAHLAPVDPLREWLDDQPWDGAPRVDTALCDLLGAADDAYVRGCSRAFFLSLAERIIRPGCQCDLTLVLVGAQGTGKTSFLRDVGGQWYAELADLASDDAVYVLGRAALIELGELAALNRADLERVKGFLSRKADTFRRKYGRDAETVPRRSVFAGTTNHRGFLIDPTGDRRFLPVVISRYVRGDTIPMLLGEARERVLAGEPWHEVPHAAAEQRRQHTPDPWISWLDTATSGRQSITMREAHLAIGVASDRASPATARRLALALRALGWEERTEGSWCR